MSEYPTVPLHKISALQTKIELAGKLSTREKFAGKLST